MGGAASLRLLRDGSFRALWIGQLISVFGDRFTYLALLAVVIEHAHMPSNPATELSWIPFMSFLPAILFGPWIGALVDRWSRKRVLVLSDATRGVIALLFLPAIPWGGLPAAFALVFLLYVANAFFLPARSAIVPEMVAGDRLVEANSLVTLAGVVATIAGSLVGGVTVARLGWRAGFAFDALTYFVSALALTGIRVSMTAHPPSHASGVSAYQKLVRDVGEGARIAFQSRRALGAIGAVALLWIAGGVLHVAAPILLAERGSGIVAGVGTILAATATGMVVGSLTLAARGGGSSPWGRTALGLAGAGAALVLFARSRAMIADLALGFMAGIFVAFLLVTTEAALQAAVRAEARVRVFSLRDFTARLLVLGTATATGALLSRRVVGAEEAVLGAGAVLAIGGSALAAWAARGGPREKHSAGATTG